LVHRCGDGSRRPIDRRGLRALAIVSLLAANVLPLQQTVLEWHNAAAAILERECGAYCERAGREARPVKTRPSRYHGQRTWPPIPSPMQAQRFTISDRYPWPLSILDKGQT